MNDLSHNKYLDGYGVDFADYDINAFLNYEIAVEYVATKEEVLLAIGSIVNVCGCNIHFLGARFLIDLVAAYVSKANFSQSEVLQAIAKAHKSTVNEVHDCILSCISYADHFAEKIKYLLGTEHNIDLTDICDVTTALGALFKIHYNYIVDDGIFDFEIRNNSEKEVQS